MGRLKKGYNWKARNQEGKKETQAEGKKSDEVKIEINLEDTKYDDCNAFMLPTRKKVKSTATSTSQKKVLSKKQRKKLEKVLERKKRKLNRSELFEKLKQVQAKPEEMKSLTSTSVIHTHGSKSLSEENKTKRKISNIAGANKKVKISNEPAESSSDDEESSTASDTDEENTVVEENEPFEASSVIIEHDKDINNDGIPCVPREDRPKSPDAENPINKINPDLVPATFVTVERKPEIQAARKLLPIFSEEQLLMEAVRENSVVLIHGETGSGKTTQVPQFLYEAGFTRNNKLIGITEPRRIAAMTMAARVGEELNMPEKVSYHIRYEKNVGIDTEIKFMTDGVLLKELSQDFFLSKYSVIIVDEAHERSVFSDVLIGLLSRIIRMREKKKDPLKLIIMSATIRVEDFTKNPRLFKTEPYLMRLDSRQYKVQLHFNIHTPEDYVEAAYKKVCKIHKQLPPGAILVFLTGENEINCLCKLLKQTFSSKNKSKKSDSRNNVADNTSGNSVSKEVITESPAKPTKKKRKSAVNPCDFLSMPNVNLDNYAVDPLNTEDLMHHQSDDESSDQPSVDYLLESVTECTPLHVLPLYSVLPFEEQQKVFEPPPDGARLCVVATNVAETSITIPGLKYVVDTGKVKNKVFSSDGGGISRFEVVWCSKASANQRAGRCGRTEGGHCYRLYSSAVFDNDFIDFSLPEIQTIPVDDILLQMKAMGIERVVDFPFPSPPDEEALKAAEKRLVLLGALQDLKKNDSCKGMKKAEFCAKATALGKAMSRFPLSPRFAKMLLLSYKHKCIQYMVAVVCALTVPNLFMLSTHVTETDEGEEKTQVVNEGINKMAQGLTGSYQRLGDVMILLRAVALYEKAASKDRFCLKNGLRIKAMAEVHKMSMQLLREVRQAFPDIEVPGNMIMEFPDESTVQTIRKIVAACLVDHVARKIPRDEAKDDKSLRKAYKCMDTDLPVFIHPSSVMFDQLPQFIVYNEMFETTKLYMKGVVEIECEWLATFASALCDFNEPLQDPPPEYSAAEDRIICSITGTFGPWRWPLPLVRQEMPPGFVKYSWFCFFFLDGQICPALAAYKGHYLSQSCVVLKSWARLLPRTKYLLEAVIGKEVDSLRTLKKIWSTDSKFLLREYWEWLPSDKHLEVELKWPPDFK